MIKPVTEITYRNKYYNINRKEIKNQPYINSANILNKASDNFVNSYYMPPNITFKGNMIENSTAPVETTANYIPENKGADHLDLPDVHVFEYPDTNLQVFVNEIQNMQDKDRFQSSLTFINKDINNCSFIQNKLFMEILIQSLKENNINANVNKDYTNFINIDFDDRVSNIDKIKTLNKLIINPNITSEQFEKCKQSLIGYVNSKKYEQDTAETNLLIDKSLLNSKEELIQEIQSTSLEDFYNYHSNTLKNSEAQYFITIDKNFVNNNKNIFYSILNSNISNKFQKHSEVSIPKLKPVKFSDDIKIYDNKNDAYLSLHYPINITSTKDKLLYKYLTLLEIFWGSPRIAENSDGHKYTLPLELKNSELNPNTLAYLEFNFTPTGNELIDSTDDAIVTFKALLEILYDEELSANTLESIKNYEKELYAERLTNPFDNDSRQEILHYFGHDIFKIYEIIDNINIEDIRNAIEETFFEQNPIVKINEQLNIY